jgi:homospermidine synthase
MMMGISMISYWIGSQRSAEEMYIKESLDKKLAQTEVRNLTSVQICGCIVACMIAYPMQGLNI